MRLNLSIVKKAISVRSSYSLAKIKFGGGLITAFHTLLDNVLIAFCFITKVIQLSCEHENDAQSTDVR